MLSISGLTHHHVTPRGLVLSYSTCYWTVLLGIFIDSLPFFLIQFTKI
jgi:hypothetical protein